MRSTFVLAKTTYGSVGSGSMALRERHNMLHDRSKFHPEVGDVVIVQSDSKNRGTWPLAVVAETYLGRDGVLRAVRLKTKNGAIEIPVQHLYPMELSCDSFPKKSKELNVIKHQFLNLDREELLLKQRECGFRR